jgi:FMN phosphatase YigB (HAD superfamily)
MEELRDVRHLLIDLDGTLLGARDLALTIDFLSRTIHEFKPHQKWHQALRTLFTLKRELHKPLPPESEPRSITNDRRAVELFGQALGMAPDMAEQFLKKTLSSVFPGMKKHFYPIQDAVTFLKWADTEFGREALTLATNPVWPEELVRLRMAWGNLDPELFGAITHAGIMHSTKPNPEYYREILELRGVSPEECILIGNDVKMDLPATRVGIKVFIISKEPTPVPVKTPSGTAPAWKSSFPGVQRALADALSKRAK